MRYLHTMVRVCDLDSALDFYCAKLGLSEIRRQENEKGRFTLVFLAAPEDRNRSAQDCPASGRCQPAESDRQAGWYPGRRPRSELRAAKTCQPAGLRGVTPTKNGPIFSPLSGPLRMHAKTPPPFSRWKRFHFGASKARWSQAVGCCAGAALDSRTISSCGSASYFASAS